MPAMIAPRSRQSGDPANAVEPPAKRARTTKPAPTSRPSALESLLAGNGHGRKLTAAPTNGVGSSRQSRVDESHAVVGTGTIANGDVDMVDAKEVVEISSDSSEGEDSEAGPGDDADGDGEPAAPDAAVAGEGVADDEEQQGGGDAPPSFGELLESNTAEPIDVEASFVHPDAPSRSLAPLSASRDLSAPSAASLTTVLTQALNTNDKELLESCFETNDLDSIRATIERLRSPLVADLLQRLAERMYKRPGRAGNLMVWVQWSLIAHGGYLASQPQLVKRLETLHRIIKERALGLQPLLTLKGKLDMLAAQLELRRNMQRSAASDDDDDDEAVIYVEGEDEESSEDEGAVLKQIEAAPEHGSEAPGPASPSREARRPKAFAQSESDDDEDMPTTANGLDPDVDDEDESEDDEGVFDDEAEETEDDGGDEFSDDGVELEDDEGEDLSESEDDLRPKKRSKGSATRTRSVQ